MPLGTRRLAAAWLVTCGLPIGCAQNVQLVGTTEATVLVTRARGAPSVKQPPAGEGEALLQLHNRTPWYLFIDTAYDTNDEGLKKCGPCGGYGLLAQPGATITPIIVFANARKPTSVVENINTVGGDVIVGPGQFVNLRVPASDIGKKGNRVMFSIKFDWQLACDSKHPGGWNEVNDQVGITVGYTELSDAPSK